MAQERIHIDLADQPDLRELVEQVRRRGTSFALQVANEDIAILERPKRSRKRKTGILTEDDPLLRLVGAFRSSEPANDSEHKHETLVRAKQEHCNSE